MPNTKNETKIPGTSKFLRENGICWSRGCCTTVCSKKEKCCFGNQRERLTARFAEPEWRVSRFPLIQDFVVLVQLPFYLRAKWTAESTERFTGFSRSPTPIRSSRRQGNDVFLGTPVRSTLTASVLSVLGTLSLSTTGPPAPPDLAFCSFSRFNAAPRK